MNEYPHGTVFIFKTTGALPDISPTLTEEIGVKMVFISGDTDLIGVVYPKELSESVARPMSNDEFFDAMFREPETDGVAQTERVKVENRHHIISNAEVNDLTMQHLGKWPSFDAQWWAGNVVDVVLNHLRETRGLCVGIEPETEQQFAAHVGVPDEVRKRAEWAADIVGVTKYSDMRVHVVQAAMTALMNDDRKYFVGDETKRKVFDANNIQNLSNLQEVFDAVERALQPKPAVEPEKQPSAVELHREAIALLSLAEKHADAIQMLPPEFESESRQIMVNEYFEYERKAIAASRKTDIQGKGIPDHDGPRIWKDRSVWHYNMRLRHSQILRVLTDQ